MALSLIQGCKQQAPTTSDQCNSLLEHYLDLETAGVADAGGATLAAARAKAREAGRTDPDVVQVTAECQEQVTQKEVTCGMAAKTVAEWNGCID